MVYHTAPAPDRHWDPSVRKDGTKAVGGQWRGQSILPEHLPRGPKLNFGSRRALPGCEALCKTSVKRIRYSISEAYQIQQRSRHFFLRRKKYRAPGGSQRTRPP